MASIETLHPLVAPEVLGCPSITIDSAILRAAIEFCEKSTAWRELLDPITVVDGTAEYALPIPTDARLVVIREKEVRLNGVMLEPIKNAAEMNPTKAGTPSHYAQRSHDALILYPSPLGIGTQTLTVFAVLAPKLTATALPDILVDRYYEAISEGAKAILKRMPNQPWSDPARAADHYRLFQVKTAEARIDFEHGLVAGSLSVKPRVFGGIVRRNYTREIV